MEALPLPCEIAFALKRRRYFKPTGDQIAAAVARRAVWARSRGPIAAVLVFTCAAIWAAKWHEARVEHLERDNAAMRALLTADRNQLTFVATGCGREELSAGLAKAAGELDLYRYLVRGAK